MSNRSLNGLNGTNTNVVITNRMLTTLPLEMTQTLFTDPIVLSMKGLNGLGTANQIMKMNATANALEWGTDSAETITVSLPLDRTGDVISLTGLTTLGTSNQIIKMNAGATALEYATENQENITVVSPLFRSGDVISLKNLNSFGSNNQILSTNGVDTCSWITPTDTTYTGSGFVSINASNVISLTLTSNSQLSNGALYITKDSTDILTNKTLTDPIINRIIGSTIGYALIVPDTKAGTIALTNDIPSVPTYSATSPLLLSGTTFSLQGLSTFGSSGQVLSTNGSNTLSWTTPATSTSEWSSAGNLIYPATSNPDTIYLANSTQAIITLTDTYVVASASKGFTIEANNTNRTFEITSVDTNIPIFKFYENTGYLDWGLLSASRMNFGYNVLYGADTAYFGLGTISNIYALTLKAKYTTTDSLTIANSSGYQVALYASSTGSNVLKIGAKMELGEATTGNMYIRDPASSVSTNNWKFYYNTASTLTYINCGSSSGTTALCVAGTPRLEVSTDKGAFHTSYVYNRANTTGDQIGFTTYLSPSYASNTYAVLATDDDYLFISILQTSGFSSRTGGVYVGYFSSGGWNYISDSKFKTDIHTLENSLDKINAMRGVSFYWNELSGKPMDDKQVGFIAQEVNEIVPEICDYNKKTESWAVDYAKLTPVLVEGIKAQQIEIDTLKSELNVYKDIVNKLMNAKSFLDFKKSIA